MNRILSARFFVAWEIDRDWYLLWLTKPDPFDDWSCCFQEGPQTNIYHNKFVSWRAIQSLLSPARCWMTDFKEHGSNQLPLAQQYAWLYHCATAPNKQFKWSIVHVILFGTVCYCWILFWPFLFLVFCSCLKSKILLRYTTFREISTF